MTFEEELEKAKYEHRLEIQRIVIDKVLFGIALLLLGAVINFGVEAYKSDEVEKKFRLEQQYKAAIELQQYAGSMLSNYSRSIAVQYDHKDFAVAHERLLESYVKSSNSVSFFFGEEFARANQLMVHMHLGLIKVDPKERRGFHELGVLVHGYHAEKLALELGIDREEKHGHLTVPKFNPDDAPEKLLVKLRNLWFSLP